MYADLTSHGKIKKLFPIDGRLRKEERKERNSRNLEKSFNDAWNSISLTFLIHCLQHHIYSKRTEDEDKPFSC